MIRFDDDNSFPQKIRDLIYTNADAIRLEKEIEHQALLNGQQWDNSIETPIYDETIASLETELTNHLAVAFHCTRIFDENEILQNGLNILDINILRQQVTSNLKRFVISNDLDEINSLFDDFIEKNKHKYRDGLLWLILSEKLSKDIGCHDLFSFYGGEVTRRALEPQREKYYPVLKQIGKPILIECIVNLNKTQRWQITNLAEQLINYGIKKVLFKEISVINAEIMIKQPILQNEILNLKKL